MTKWNRSYRLAADRFVMSACDLSSVKHGVRSELGHFRPINDVCAMSAFHPTATKLLHSIAYTLRPDCLSAIDCSPAWLPVLDSLVCRSSSSVCSARSRH